MIVHPIYADKGAHSGDLAPRISIARFLTPLSWMCVVSSYQNRVRLKKSAMFRTKSWQIPKSWLRPRRTRMPTEVIEEGLEVLIVAFLIDKSVASQ